jgi:glutamate synthase (NADPH/NADH) large chain
MVDLDPIDEEGSAELRNMISEHLQYTKSAVARFILEDFENQLKHFIKVFPKDFKRVLLAKSARTSVNVSR